MRIHITPIDQVLRQAIGSEAKPALTLKCLKTVPAQVGRTHPLYRQTEKDQPFTQPQGA